MTGAADPDAVLAWMRAAAPDMTRMLEELIGIETPTTTPQTHDRALALLETSLRDAGYETERLPGEGVGDHLRAVPRDFTPGTATQLLLGHIDTVWDEGTLATMPLTHHGDVLSGPGSFDMKAGLVQMVFALRCLSELGIEAQAAPLVLINSDEEIGSPDSTPLIEQMASTASRAFVMEGSHGPGGDLKTARKGVGRFKLTVKGVAAHAGLDPGSGASAVLEVAQQIQRIFELNDLDAGISVNVGTVDGGMRPNVVAPEATAEIDCRVPTYADAVRIEAALASLQPTRDDVHIEIAGGFRRLPMEPTERNRALWNTAKSAAETLGIDIDEVSVGGASDGNTTSQFTATLDGLGGVGGGAHAPHEHVLVSKLPERAALLTLLLAAPVEAGETTADAS